MDPLFSNLPLMVDIITNLTRDLLRLDRTGQASQRALEELRRTFEDIGVCDLQSDDSTTNAAVEVRRRVVFKL